MRTPAGKECRYYHEDFHRGRDVQECRLIQENPASLRWRPSDCKMCPVPDILNANASPDLQLTLTVKPRLMGLGRQLEVTASCLKHHVKIEDPFVGCPKCNAERPGLDVFWQALEQDDDE
jgi:hypothetical protein